MNLSEIFIRRPVMTTLIMLAILIFGTMAYRNLPVNDLPTVDFPTVSVSANLPGASPETMASAVAVPLEKEFSTIPGLDSMTSSNSQGSTNITLQFTLDRDIDSAAQDVQAAISKSLRSLPSDMPNPPSYQKVNPADSPILYMALSSPLLPLSKVDEYAQTFLAQRIASVQGVAQVSVFGSQKYAVRIQLDPRKLATLGIGVEDVTLAIRRGNVNMPTGTLQGSHQAFTVESEGQLNDAKEYRPLIVAWRGGRPVRLEDVAQVIDSVENTRSSSWYKDTRAVVLAVQRQPGTNTVQVVDRIREILPTVRAQIPPSVSLDILFDRSESIRESVNEVKFTLVLTLGLVVLVIFLFLRNIRATIIPSLALPMSIVCTFAIMYAMGFSLNNISLIALVLSVGFVVDDAIVMLENIVRHIEMGERPLQAALKGSREIGFTIISMTASLVAVFIPVLFMGGIVGRILNEFAVSIAAAILVSGFVSLSLTPMLCGLFLKPHDQERHGRLFNASEKVFTALQDLYRVTLAFTLRHKLITISIFFITVGLTVYLFREIPKGFLPSEDRGMIFGQTEAAQGTSYESMVRHQLAVNRVLLDEPNIDAFMSSVGSGNTGRVFIHLKPRHDRELDADQVIQKMRPALSEIPGVRAFFQNPPPISFGGRLSRSQFQFTLQSPNTDELYHYAPILEQKLHQIPILQDVASDLQITNPQVNVNVNRDKAAALGLSVQQVEEALFSAYGSRQVSTIFAPNNDYRVVMELAPEYQSAPESLSMLYIRSNTGRLIPLNTLATIERSVGPLSINHQGQLPAVTLSFNTPPGVALGDALEAVREAADSTLPQSISTSFQGTAQAFNSSMAGLGLLLALAILVIYLVLGILYESFIHPITILSGLPSAGVGALLALMIFDMDLNLYSFVGVILLVGIVKKNAIMMIDFALEAQRTQKLNPEQAIMQGCLIRFRPIMMTTMAALTGTLPIALGVGGGAASRRPLGVAVVGGLVLSQLLTLYITPVFFIYLEALRTRLARVFKRAPARISPTLEPEAFAK